jgi:hypothetical protein
MFYLVHSSVETTEECTNQRIVVSPMTNLMRNLVSGIVIALIVVTASFAAGSPLVVTPGTGTQVGVGSTQQFSVTTAVGGYAVAFWRVSGPGCSGLGCGSITITGGLYTSPSNITSPLSVTITATSIRDYSSTGSVTITVNPGISQGSGGTAVSIAPPGPLQLNAGASQPFSATVVGPSNTAVTWSVGGAGCAGNCGTITQAGVYTAPAQLSRAQSATITATSQATPSVSASVTVQVVPVIAVTIAQFNPQMGAGASQLFSAAVSGTAIQAVTWSVSGTGCAGPSCGTISTSGFYTAPFSVPSTMNVTVKAASQADLSKFATAVITLGPIVTMSVSPSGLSLSVNSEQQYSVSITGAANTAVLWSVSGAGCNGASCGTVLPILASTALYQAPAGIPSPANVNVTATLVSDSSKSASAVATIVPLSNSRLNGQYAFLFKGFDPSGTYLAAGSVTADGNGHLTSGTEDINCGVGAADPICAGGPVFAQTLTGTYTVNADGRGTFTITPSSGPTQTFTLAVESSNAKARFIESDASVIRGSGVLELQTPSAFTTSALSNIHFAFGLAGVDSKGKPIAAIGNMGLVVNPFTLVPIIQAGILDVNDNGVLACYPQEFGTSPCSSVMTQRFSGTYAVGANGRGTASFTIQGFDGTFSGLSTFNFSFYVVSSGELFLISTDPGMTANPILSGQALQQLLPASAAFQPGPAVFSWSGVTASTGIPQAAVGQVSLFDGAGNVIGLDYDLNNGGVMSWLNGQGVCSTTNKKGQTVVNGQCTYALQPNNDFVVYNKCLLNCFPVLRIFPTSTNTGFLLGPPPSVTVGKIEPQVVAFPSPFMIGSDLMVAPTASLVSGTGGLTQVSAPAGPVTGNEDESETTMFMPNLLFNGQYSPTGLPNGRAFMNMNSVPSVVFWVINSNKMVGLDVDTGAAPNIIFFEH